MSKTLDEEPPSKKGLPKALMCRHLFLAYPWKNFGFSCQKCDWNDQSALKVFWSQTSL